jgi:hypothetical protein
MYFEIKMDKKMGLMTQKVPSMMFTLEVGLVRYLRIDGRLRDE